MEMEKNAFFVVDYMNMVLASCNRLYREKHTEVSEFLGVTYRHLLYVLADFVKRGFLKKTEQGYYIQDLKTLRKIAEGFEP